MTLSIPPADDWTTLQFVLDLIARQFPLGTQQLQDSSVTSAKIKDGTIAAADLATGIVLQLNTTGTARKLAFGLKAVTFTAANSVTTTVTHGMSSTPVQAMAFGANNATAAFNVWVDNTSLGATTFPLAVAVSTGAAVSTTINVPWLAIA